MSYDIGMNSIYKNYCWFICYEIEVCTWNSKCQFSSEALTEWVVKCSLGCDLC